MQPFRHIRRISISPVETGLSGVQVVVLYQGYRQVEEKYRTHQKEQEVGRGTQLRWPLGLARKICARHSPAGSFLTSGLATSG